MKKTSRRQVRYRFRNRALRAGVWVFLAIFIISVLGVALVARVSR